MLEVKDLRTYFLRHPYPPIKAVDGLSYSVAAGEMVAIVGDNVNRLMISAFYTTMWPHITELINKFEKRFDEVRKHHI